MRPKNDPSFTFSSISLIGSSLGLETELESDFKGSAGIRIGIGIRNVRNRASLAQRP